MKKSKILFAVLLTVIIAVSYMGCNPLVDNETTPVTTNSSKISFYAKDSVTGMALNDTLRSGVSTVFIGIVNSGFQVDHWEFQWGWNAEYTPGTTTTIMGIHRYNLSNVYITIVLKAWDVNGVLEQFSKTFWIAGINQTIDPICKLGSTPVQIDYNTWQYDIWLLKRAIDSTCSVNGTPQFADTANGFVYETMTISSDPRYYHIVKNLDDNTNHCFTYRRDPNCWATIAPRPGNWTSIYYLPLPIDKLGISVYAGQMTTIGAIHPTVPGIVGDSTVRFGVSPNLDSIYVYFNKAKANGTTNPYWLSTIYGIGNQVTIINTEGFSSWWHTAFHRNQVPVNTTVAFRFGTSQGLAYMAGSEYWDASNQWLAILIASIGDKSLNVRKAPAF